MTMSSGQYFRFILLLQVITLTKPCADIVFVLDGSSSTKEQFKQMINMAGDIAKQFDVEKRGHRIAILEYSSKLIQSKWLRYPFDQIKTNTEMEKVIQNLPHIRGTTNTGRALSVVFQEFLQKNRPGLPFLIFTITDGYYRDPKEVQQNVENLVAKENVQLFTATISKLHNMNGLLFLVNNNSSHIITNKNFLNISQNILKRYSKCRVFKSSLIPKKAITTSTIKTTANITSTTIKHRINGQRNVHKQDQELGPKIGNLAKLSYQSVRLVSKSSARGLDVSTRSTTTIKNFPMKNNIKPECLLDVVFLMDFSGGVSDKRDVYIDFVSNLIRSLDLNQTSARVAVIYYSGPKRSHTLFHLRKHNRIEEAIKDLQRAPSNGGTTRTGEAIYYAINEFDEKFGARKGAKKMMIIFTDGYSQDDPTEASRLAHSKSIELKVVSVEDEDIPPDMEQIIAITGNPSDAYSSKNFMKLQLIFHRYSRRCKL